MWDVVGPGVCGPWRLGMSVDEVVALRGEPDEHNLDSPRSMVWYVAEGGFSQVWYDDAHKVTLFTWCVPELVSVLGVPTVGRPDEELGAVALEMSAQCLVFVGDCFDEAWVPELGLTLGVDHDLEMAVTVQTTGVDGVVGDASRVCRWVGAVRCQTWSLILEDAHLDALALVGESLAARWSALVVAWPVVRNGGVGIEVARLDASFDARSVPGWCDTAVVFPQAWLPESAGLLGWGFLGEVLVRGGAFANWKLEDSDSRAGARRLMRYVAGVRAEDVDDCGDGGVFVGALVKQLRAGGYEACESRSRSIDRLDRMSGWGIREK